MKNNINQEPENITVVIQGETDWLSFSFNPSELDMLKKPIPNLALWGALMGEILDGSQSQELPTEKKQKVERLLARYVANLENYELMLLTGANTMVITSLRIRDGKRTGYGTRVAGFIDVELDDISIFVGGMPAPLEPHFILLLHLMSQNPFYTGESKNYDRKSIFHDLMRQAKMMEDKIEIRIQADPNLQ